MKKRIPAKSTRIQPVKLCLEEVSELVSFFRQYCETVEISDDKAVYDSLEEASEKITGPITNLEIAGKRPNVKLSLKNNGSWLTQEFDKPELTTDEIDRHDLLYVRVKDFLSERRTRGLFLFTFLFVVFLITIGTGLVVRKPPHYIELMVFGGWLSMCTLLATKQVFGKDIGSVSLKPRAESSSFWSRNKDKIGLLLLGAAISEAVNLLAHYTSK